MCEEIGWRGFALPHLQKRHNALLATLIVGILWGLWHLLLVFLAGPMSEFPFLWFFIIVTNAFIYTGLTQLAQNVGGASLHHAVIEIRLNTYERLGVLVAELNN